MLSFLQEQPSDKSVVQDSPEQQKTGDDYITIKPADKNAVHSTVFLAVLFTAGLMVLFFMIKKSNPKQASAIAIDTEQARIESAVARLTGITSGISGGIEDIVGKFYQFSKPDQVQLEKLKKNPFSYDLGGNNSGEFFDMKAADESADIRQRAQALQLLSIIRSKNGKFCMINDRILETGDSIAGFTIKNITENAVTVEMQNVEIILKLLE